MFVGNMDKSWHAQNARQHCNKLPFAIANYSNILGYMRQSNADLTIMYRTGPLRFYEITSTWSEDVASAEKLSWTLEPASAIIACPLAVSFRFEP